MSCKWKTPASDNTTATTRYEAHHGRFKLTNGYRAIQNLIITHDNSTFAVFQCACLVHRCPCSWAWRIVCGRIANIGCTTTYGWTAAKCQLKHAMEILHAWHNRTAFAFSFDLHHADYFGQAVGPNASGRSQTCISFFSILRALNPYAGVQLAAPAKCKILSMKRPLPSQRATIHFHLWCSMSYPATKSYYSLQISNGRPDVF